MACKPLPSCPCRAELGARRSSAEAAAPAPECPPRQQRRAQHTELGVRSLHPAQPRPHRQPRASGAPLGTSRARDLKITIRHDAFHRVGPDQSSGCTARCAAGVTGTSLSRRTGLRLRRLLRLRLLMIFAGHAARPEPHRRNDGREARYTQAG